VPYKCSFLLEKEVEVEGDANDAGGKMDNDEDQELASRALQVGVILKASKGKKTTSEEDPDIDKVEGDQASGEEEVNEEEESSDSDEDVIIEAPKKKRRR
jgi:hypothetical protein